MSDPVTYVLMLAGGFSIAAGVCDWDWFMNHPKAAFWVKLIGRGPTRGLYIAIGVLVAGVGIGMAAGLIRR